MLLILELTDYNDDNVIFYKSVKNNIIHNSNYSKMIYSSTLFTMNSIYIGFSLINYCKHIYNNKVRYTFHLLENNDIINKIKHIEEKLLQKYLNHNNNIIGKQSVYKISQQLNNGNFRVIVDDINSNKQDNIKFLLKISGIWETATEYGASFTFYAI